MAYSAMIYSNVLFFNLEINENKIKCLFSVIYPYQEFFKQPVKVKNNV